MANYLHFQIIVFTIDFMFGMGSKPHLSSLHHNDVSSDGFGVDLSECWCLEVNSGIEEVECGIGRVEVGEEKGGARLGDLVCDLNGRLLNVGLSVGIALAPRVWIEASPVIAMFTVVKISVFCSQENE